MFDPSRFSTRTGFTPSVAFLVAAFILSPAVLSVSPLSYLTVPLAMACSALCAALAWVAWKKSSPLSVPSIAIRNGETK